ncbi:hypothetical protein BU17DRAFT_62196 [Hysterangium stoloniferum]|nr:hypothetical protein BU17DRAFT_62196 [Hysterangium stoloniferum]
MSGDTTRDLFSLTPGSTHELHRVNICINEERFSLAEYAVVQQVTWYKTRSDHYQHEFLLVEFKHAKLVTAPLYCVVTRGTSEIKEMNVQDSELDKEYGEDAPTTPPADIPLNQMDKTGEIRVVEGQDYIKQVHANPDLSNEEVAKRNGGPTSIHRPVTRYSHTFSSVASATASSVTSKDISDVISSGIVNGAAKVLDLANYQMLALDQLMFSTDGSSEFIKVYWNNIEVCRTLDMSGRNARRFTLANLVLLASIANRYHRKYRLAGYQCYWYASVIFDAIVEITGAKTVDGPAVSKRGQFGRVKVVRGRHDTLGVILQRYHVKWTTTEARIAELKNPEIVAKRIAQLDARAAQSDARAAQSDARAAQSDARAAQLDARAAQLDARAAQSDARAAEETQKREAAEERTRQLEADNARKDTMMAEMQQQMAALSGNSAHTR